MTGFLKVLWFLVFCGADWGKKLVTLTATLGSATLNTLITIHP
jgi:hypothetical protein